MRSREKHDHLASSFTDLMSSLAVIFILLFLAFVHEQESRQEKVKDRILSDLQKILKNAQLGKDNIKKEGDAVVIIVPDSMTFDTGSPILSGKGVKFLSDYIPLISQTLYADRADVDSIVVEGHTDRRHGAGRTPEQGEEDNLTLSQKRSMAVVHESLADLEKPGFEDEHKFFLKELSATGRGEEEANSEAGHEDDRESRCVKFRIRVRATALQDATETIRAGLK